MVVTKEEHAASMIFPIGQPGNVVNIPIGVKHWHGAAPDSWFSHLAVEVPSEETSNEWPEAVSEIDYEQATKG